MSDVIVGEVARASASVAASEVPTWTLWLPVGSALGAAVLTALATWGISEWQDRRRRQAGSRQVQASAYADFMVHSLDFMNRVQALGQVVRLRTGITEGIAVTFGQRKPVETLSLYDWLDSSMKPLHTAWSQIWLVGSQEAMDAADRLMDASADFTGAATATDSSRNALVRAIKGEVPSPEQVAAFEAALKRVSQERVAFARVVRKEMGRDEVKFALERAEEERAAHGAH